MISNSKEKRKCKIWLLNSSNSSQTMRSHAFCMLHASRYFLVMISIDAYTTILCRLWYYAGSFPSMAFSNVSVHQLVVKLRDTYTNSPFVSCAYTWAVCREILQIRPSFDWKIEFKVMMLLWKDWSALIWNTIPNYFKTIIVVFENRSYILYPNDILLV